MTRILTLGDPHFHHKAFQLERSLEMASAFTELCRERKPDAIVVLGDTLHQHARMDLQTRCHAVAFLSELKKIAPLFVIIGNHDRINNQEFETPVHPFVGEKQWPNTYIIDETQEHEIDGKLFLFVPYVPEDRIHEVLTPWEVSNYHAVFSHIEVKGAMVGGKASEADEWTWEIPLITGHIHNKHRVGDFVSYPGTPIHMSFGEDGEKTVSEYTFSDAPVQGHWCKSRHGCVAEETFKLPVEPLQTLTMTPKEFFAFHPPKDVRSIRFSIKGKDVEIQKLKTSDRYAEWVAKGVLFKFPRVEAVAAATPTEHKGFLQIAEEALLKEDPEVREAWETIRSSVLS